MFYAKALGSVYLCENQAPTGASRSHFIITLAGVLRGGTQSLTIPLTASMALNNGRI